MKKTIVTLIIAVVTLLSVAAAGFLYFARQPSEDLSDLTPPARLSSRDLKKIPQETETVNVLVCGVDYSLELTDVIMYIQYDPKAGSARVLSIPRDTYIGDETYATGKINQVYKASGSMDTLVDEVRGRFALPVDYYATITLDALGSIVDQIGGVEVTIPQDLYENGVKIMSEGTQTLSGEQALMYVRIRHAYADADLGRIEAQHNFMLAALRKVQSLGKLDLLQLVMENYSHVKTDMPLTRIVSVAASAFGMDEVNIKMFTVPGTGKMNYSYAVYEVDGEGLAQILNENFLLESEGITADDLDFPRVVYQPPAAYPAPEEEETHGEEDAADADEEGAADEEFAPSDEEEPPQRSEPPDEEDDGKPHARKRTDVSSRDWNKKDGDWRNEY